MEEQATVGGSTTHYQRRAGIPKPIRRHFLAEDDPKLKCSLLGGK